jgi:hypothetical protein
LRAEAKFVRITVFTPKPRFSQGAHVKDSTHPLVAVVWDDAKATAVVEYDLNEVRTQFHRAARYTTYGLLLVDDEKGITLASEEGDDHNLRGLTFIPRAMIVEVVVLGRQRAKKARAKRQPAAPPPAPSKSAPAQPAAPQPAPSAPAPEARPGSKPGGGPD